MNSKLQWSQTWWFNDMQKVKYNDIKYGKLMIWYTINNK